MPPKDTPNTKESTNIRQPSFRNQLTDSNLNEFQVHVQNRRMNVRVNHSLHLIRYCFCVPFRSCWFDLLAVQHYQKWCLNVCRSRSIARWLSLCFCRTIIEYPTRKTEGCNSHSNLAQGDVGVKNENISPVHNAFLMKLQIWVNTCWNT